MPNFGIWTNGLFGTSSNVPPAPGQGGSRRYEGGSIVDGTKPNCTSTTSTSTNINSSKTLHGVITSALWTIARTPALVEAIDREEDRYRGTKQLSSVLRALRHPVVLTNSSRWRDATENADAYLAASNMSLYDSMEPMDAIRGIAGLCGDSEVVFKEAVEATYKTLVTCIAKRCLYREEMSLEREEQLRCTRKTAQLTVDSRATPSSTTRCYPCKACGRKVAAKTFVLVGTPPPCLVATWPCLTPVDPAQDKLIVRSSSESFPYKLSVVITSHQKKTVCMFREGQDYYRVEGHDVKKVQATEWLTAKPQLALFTRQQPLGGTGASVISIPPTPNRAGGGGGGPGKKRRRAGDALFSESAKGWGPTAAKAAEVIEVNDDDSDEGGAPANVERGGDGDGISDVDSWQGRKGYRSGAAVEGAGAGRSTGGAGGESGSARDAGGRGLKRAPEEALDEDGEEVRTVGESSVGAAGDREAGGSRTDPARTEPSSSEAGSPSSGSTWSVSLFKLLLGAGPAAEPDQQAVLDAPRPSSSPAGRPPSDEWEQYGGSWGEAGDSANRRGGPRSRAAGTVARHQSAAETHDRKSPSHEDLTTGDEGLRAEDDDSDDDVQLVTGHTPGGVGRGGTLASSSPAQTARADEIVNDDGRDNIEEMESRKRDAFSGAGARGSAVATPSPAAAPVSSSSSSYTSTAATSSSGILPRVRSSYAPPHISDVIGGDGTNTAAAVTAAIISAVALSADLSISGSAPSSSTGAASSSRHPRAAQSRSEWREVHAVDDTPTAPPLDEGQQEEGGGGQKENEEEAKFIGPARPSPIGVRLVGPARPPGRALPRLQQQLSDFRFETCTAPARESRKESLARSGGADGDSGDDGDGGFRRENTNTKKSSSWLQDAAKRPPAGVASDRGDGEWLPAAGTREPAEGFGRKKNVGRSKECAGAGVGATRGGPVQKVMEDLTEADGSSQETDGARGGGRSGGGGDGGGSGGDGLISRVQRDETTLTTIRGINLQQNHFDRIVNSDGWLTSQIIDIRVKQLQEKYPENLYFDSSFFGFLCPTTDKGGAFVVDYERVRGWTKSSRLPAGKSSLFDLRKLFIPINQGNVHWVLVVVDMEDPDDGGKSGGGGSKVVSFFDSFGKDGTSYVEAVQQYLVSELSSRDKTREGLFATEPTPPRNSPQQHNSSDCGVLMLHVMEKLSVGPASGLTSLSQEEVMCLRLQLVANIRE